MTCHELRLSASYGFSRKGMSYGVSRRLSASDQDGRCINAVPVDPLCDFSRNGLNVALA